MSKYESKFVLVKTLRPYLCYPLDKNISQQSQVTNQRKKSAVYMEGGTGRFPGRDVFYPAFKNCLYGRRDGMFAKTGRFLSRL